MKLPIRNKQLQDSRSGVAVVEFALVAPLLVAMFLGVVGIGVSLGRAIQSIQITRDLAHMYASGVDFTKPGNQALAVFLANGTGMTATGGNGVVIFTRITTVYQVDCTAAG